MVSWAHAPVGPVQGAEGVDPGQGAARLDLADVHDPKPVRFSLQRGRYCQVGGVAVGAEREAVGPTVIDVQKPRLPGVGHIDGRQTPGPMAGPVGVAVGSPGPLVFRERQRQRAEQPGGGAIALHVVDAEERGGVERRPDLDGGEEATPLMDLERLPRLGHGRRRECGGELRLLRVRSVDDLHTGALHHPTRCGAVVVAVVVPGAHQRGALHPGAAPRAPGCSGIRTLTAHSSDPPRGPAPGGRFPAETPARSLLAAPAPQRRHPPPRRRPTPLT